MLEVFQGDTYLIDLIKENGFTLKKQEADDILQKLWQMQIMIIT